MARCRRLLQIAWFAQLLAPHVALRTPPSEDGVLGFLDEFQFLGSGFCLDSQGQRPPRLAAVPGADGIAPDFRGSWQLAEVLQDGSSPTCAERCLQQAGCSGYIALRRGSCAVILDKGFLPSSADNATGASCFWRHHFIRDSSGAYREPRPIPKIIWSFWEEPEPSLVQDYWYDTPLRKALHVLVNGAFHLLAGTARAPMVKSPPFIQLCMETWRRLNPDYQVHVLNQTTLWHWVNRSDLPRKYDELMIQHKADAIRQALLVKHGGVWMDASILLLKPLREILGSDPASRSFFYTDNRIHPSQERRVDERYYVENWVLAAPPRDPLLVQTQSCFAQFFSEEGSWSSLDMRDLASSGQFSRRQLEELEALGLNSYFAMYACLFKAIDEDAALWRWWKGPRVRHLDSWKSAFVLFRRGWGPEAWFERLLSRVDRKLVAELTAPTSLLIKFPAMQRDAMIGLSAEQLWKSPNTLREVLELSLESY